MINLYNIDNTDYTKNGNATLEPTRCDFTIGVNEAWSVQVEIPMDDQGKWKLVKKDVMLKIDVDCVREFASTQQLFRVDNYRKEDRTVIINAFSVGMEARHDVLIENYTGKNKTASEVISDFSNFIENNKYNLYTNLSTSGSITLSNSNLISALSYGNDGSFTKVFGGEIVYDNYNIKILNRIGNSVADAHPVIYGKNMTGISYTEDSSGIVTRICPVSSDGIHLNGTGYVDSEHASDYPYLRKRYMGAPYQLIDDVENPITQTQITTRAALDAVKNSAKQLSYNAMIHAVSAEGDNIPYGAIKKYKSDIIEAVSDMATTHCYQTTLDSKMKAYIKDGINDKLAGMMAVPEPKHSWHGSYEDGWWYGDADTFWSTNKAYERNKYAYISKKWSYFGNDGTWEAPKDDEGDWDWWQPQDGLVDSFKYGNFDRYYAKDEWIYITENGTLTAYWINGDGYYDSSYTEASTWTWHGSGTEADPYWFGASDAAGDPDKYAHDQWVFIDYTLYYFDNEGFYDGITKKEFYQWDWVESGNKYWFGNNEDKTFAAIFLKSQWAKIDSEYYYFDSDGYALDEEEMKIMIIESFLTSMASLLTVVDAQKDILYAKLYELMTSWCEKQYDDNHIDLPSVTISVNMIDLSKTLEYKKYAQLERICLGDAVDCQNPVMNIYSTERIIGLTYDCIRGYNTNIIIGHTEASLGSVLGSNSSGSSVPSGFDTSAIESAITTNSNSIASLQNTKQDKLTAGDNITIVNNVISTTGGAGLQYWHETPTRFYREGTHEGISGLANYLKPSNNEIGYYESGAGWNRSIVVRLKGNTRNVIMGITWQQGNRHPLICFASQDSLDFEWGYSDNTFQPPFGVAEWNDKSTYPVPTSGYDWYFGYATATATYEGTTWNILLVDCLYWDGGDGYAASEGVAEFSQGKWENKPDASLVGYDLLEAAQASDQIEVITEIGTQNYAFKYGGDNKTFTYIDTDGNALFKEITTDAGTLTAQMAAKQDNLIAGSNIQIAADGKTISATDTDEISELDDVNLTNLADGEILRYDATNQEWVNVDVDSIVEANPSGSASATLNKVAIDNVIYSLPSGGGGGGGSFVGLTKSQYDALPTADKEDTSKLYFVQEGGGGTLTTPVDMSGGTPRREGSMTFNTTSTSVQSVWNGGSSIGGQYTTKAIDLTDIDELNWELVSTTCYAHNNSNVEEQTNANWHIFVGLSQSIPTSWANASTFSLYAEYKYTNTTYSSSECKLDVSSLTGVYYITLVSHGWNLVFSNLKAKQADKAEITRHTYWNNAKWSQWASNRITYGTTTPTGDANDGDLYILLDGNNSKQGEYLYMNNAWVQIE